MNQAMVTTRPGHFRVVRLSIFAVVSYLLLANAAMVPPGVDAQLAAIVWSQPANLSDSPTSSTHPELATDDFGFVHLFWSEDVGGEPLAPDETAPGGNTILYRRWDGRAWTPPVDIFFTGNDPYADYLRSYVDADQRLHVVWTGVRNIYYASANAWETTSAPGWTEPQIISEFSARTRWESDLVVDTAGTIHVVYAGRGPELGLNYTRSADGGLTWSSPVAISAPLSPPEQVFSVASIELGDNGTLHVTWQTVNDVGYGQSIYYSRSVDTGATWESPRLLERSESARGFVNWPNITLFADGTLLLIHGQTEAVGRIQRYSRDNGENWEARRHIVQELVGDNGFVFPLVDGAGRRHLLANIRTLSDQVNGIYYAAEASGERGEFAWSDTIPIMVDAIAAPTAHYNVGVVRLGREIHLAWTQNRGGEIWHMQGDIVDIAGKQAAATPTPVPTPVIQEASTSDDFEPPDRDAMSPELRLRSPESPDLGPLLSFVITIAFVGSVVFVRRWLTR